MTHIPASNLTPSLKESLSLLVADCQRAEPLTLSLPEDADDFLVQFDEPGDPSLPSASLSPLAFLGICRVSPELWECYGFTHPSRRRQGLFSLLLDALDSLVQKEEEKGNREIQLVFLSDQRSSDGLAAGKALGMEYWYSEYQMELSLEQWSRAPLQKRELSLKKTWVQEESGEYWDFQAYSAKGEPIGSCRLLPYSPSRYYLYHVEISPALRGKGWGAALLQAVFLPLPSRGSIFLQVSSDNAPALALYKKTGFRITEALSYFLY